MSPTLVVGVDGTPLFRRVDGIGRYTANLLRATAEARPDWRFVVIGFRDDAGRPSLVPDLPNVEVVLLPAPRRAYQAVFSYLARVPVGRLLPRFDVHLATNYVAFPHLPGVPAVSVVYDLTYVDLPEVVEARNLGYLRRHVPRTVRESAAVAAISPFTAARVDEEFPGHPPVHVVDCALDPTFLAPAPAPGGEVPGLPDGYVLAVGTLEPRKNLVTLLRAYALLDPAVRDAHPLVVVGKQGWGPGDVPADVPADVVAGVRFTGYVPDADLPSVYRGARLFVFPSRYEGFGLPLLEAMACGVPAIASDIPPFRTIGQDLVDYADPGDPAAFAAAITAALTAPQDDPARAARTARAADAAGAWTWDRSARQLVAAVTDALDGRR
ncbi:glycosyltransferase family 4 protein [Cellulomonas sp. ACRRI]|uniref:glycosyltransferase family 4 protein n=1 Tax=Cellulomonas sp. ACRRI TaxID=2918188 RepID=UPI001EF30185|nr:glycosyltransferase family 1 protein [Cellulomonas sp. ACRRI]MCG7285414.1 glycosyltransferase family 4 protein [Cellulomonas sp. ACRRI]